MYINIIFFRLFNLEIKNKYIIEEKDKFVQNLQGASEEQKLIEKLQDKNNENNQVLAKLQVAKQKINNMEKQNKDLENIKIDKGLFASNFEGDRFQLLQFKGIEGYSECGAQQTFKKLQECGVDFLEAVEGVGRTQNGSWKCVSSQE